MQDPKSRSTTEWVPTPRDQTATISGPVMSAQGAPQAMLSRDTGRDQISVSRSTHPWVAEVSFRRLCFENQSRGGYPLYLTEQPTGLVEVVATVEPFNKALTTSSM